MEFSKKQLEYIRNSNCRWNVKSGATGGGKTHIDMFYVIPQRIIERKGMNGLNVIMGVTKETIERNVLQPMRQYYGETIGTINNRNMCRILGEDVYCLGAEKVSQVSKVQGATFKYLYCDEVARWNEEVFNFVKSRLRTPVSCADLTCNPEHPEHFFKKFLDSDADIYHQHYTIDDNPFYPEDAKEALKKEYFGTVYYDRLILGLWKRAEGSIYKVFSDNEQDFYIENVNNMRFIKILVGIDFGKNKSKHAFTAIGITAGFKDIIVLKAVEKVAKDTTPEHIYQLFNEFQSEIKQKYRRIDEVYADSAEQTMINGMRANCCKNIYDSDKGRIMDRIKATLIFMSQRRLKLLKNECTALADAFKSSVYDPKKYEDERLDNGTVPIDILDSFEYSWNFYSNALTGKPQKNR